MPSCAPLGHMPAQGMFIHAGLQGLGGLPQHSPVQAEHFVVDGGDCLQPHG